MKALLLQKRCSAPVISFLLLLLLYGDIVRATPTCPIISQSFQNSVNGATSDTSATGWTLNASGIPNATYFAVMSHRLRAANLGGYGIWTSKVFSIAGYTAPQASVKITAEGPLIGSSDSVFVYYKLNGGPLVLIAVDTGNFGTQIFTSPVFTGNNVQLVVKIINRVHNTQQPSLYYIEQYNVFQTAGPCTPGTASIPVSASATNAGVLSCAHNSTVLSATSSTTGLTYWWTGPNSFHTSSASPTVSTAGTYLLTVTTATGWGSTSVVVTSNTTVPAGVTAANNGPVTCAKPSVTLTGASSTAGVTFNWSGPNSFSAPGASVSTTVGGSYTVTATHPVSGCTATATTSVVSNATAPAAVSISASGSLSCTSTSVSLTASSTTTGVTFAWSGPGGAAAGTGATISITAPGTYTVTATNPASGCTATASTTVSQSTTAPGSVTAAASGALTCTTTNVTLTGSSTLTGVTYAWSGPGGAAAGTGTTISVAAPGTYTVTATNAASGCTASASTVVVQDITVPAGLTTSTSPANATLTCGTNVINLSGRSTSAGVSFVWTGPNNFNVASSQVNAFNPGTYTLTATNTANGCTAAATATVVQNIAPPALAPISPSAATLTCANPSVTLTGSSSTAGVSYGWAGPGGFTAIGTTAVANTQGSYILTVTDPTNGCINTTTAVIGQNFAPPAAVSAINNGPLTCTMTSVTLTGSSSTAGVSYSWAGPGGFTAVGATAVVSAPGTYTLTVTNPVNGCTSITNTVVAQNINGPSNLLVGSNTGGTLLTCTNSTIVLTAQSTTAGTSFSWAGPGGFSALTPDASISTPGSYQVTATDPSSGCSSALSTLVSQNIAVPAGIGTSSVPANGLLNCSQSNIILSGTSSTPGVHYSWSGPGGFLADSSVATAINPGSYTLTVTDPSNGCVSSGSATVTQDLTAPASVTATPSNQLTCAQNKVTLTGNSTTAGVTYAWSGPNNFSSTLRVTTTTVGGVYTLIATNPATGCKATKSITVQQNINPPANVTIAPPATLTCDVSSVDLVGNSTTAGVLYVWSGPDDFSDVAPVTSVSEPGDYTLTVTNPTNGCSSTAVVTVDQDLTACEAVARKATNGVASSLSTDKTATVVPGSAFSYKIYPNPVSSTASIDVISPKRAHVVVSFYNSTGIREKLLFDGVVDASRLYKFPLDASGFTPGIHFCIINVDGKMYSSKVLLAPSTH